MKNLTLSIFAFLSGFYNLNAQCTNASTGFGNNTNVVMYNVTGNVEVILNTNNTVTINLLSNFATAAGPDVHIFLVNRGNLTNTMLKIPANFLLTQKIDMGISPASGMASFTKPIPDGMNISDFNTVYFFCQAFSQFWDFGSITPFSVSNCAFLGTTSLEKTNFKIYPNPAKNELNIELNEISDILETKIYNVLGNLVINQNSTNIQNRKIDISILDSGVYFVVLKNKSNISYIERFIKQ